MVLNSRGDLFGAEPAIQIAANRGMARIARQLAHVVDVVDHALHAHQGIVGLAGHIVGVEHPGIEDRADHGIALHEGSNLLVGKLAIAGHERPAVVVAGEHWAVVDLK